MRAASLVDTLSDAGPFKVLAPTNMAFTVTQRHGHAMIADAAGHKADVIDADVEQSNAVVHVIDRVLLP